jgi:hypothetical protein
MRFDKGGGAEASLVMLFLLVSLEVRKRGNVPVENGTDCEAARRDHIRMPSPEPQLFLPRSARI